MLDTSGVVFELEQVYDTSDQGLCKAVQKVIYLPDDSPDLMAVEDEVGRKRFHSRELIKGCVVLGLWKLREDDKAVEERHD